MSYKIIKDIEQVSAAIALRLGSEVRDVWRIYDEEKKLLCTAYSHKIANRVAGFLERNSKYGRAMKHKQDQRILRSIFLDPQTDSEYRRLAFMMGSDKQELMRWRSCEYFLILERNFFARMPRKALDMMKKA